MNKNFATFEISVALKELEFDKNCFGSYEILGDKKSIYDSILYKIRPDQYISSPLWQQVISWFEEEKHIFLNIACYVDLGYKSYSYKVQLYDTPPIDWTGEYDNRTECLENAILKGIEILNKNNKI